MGQRSFQEIRTERAEAVKLRQVVEVWENETLATLDQLVAEVALVLAAVGCFRSAVAMRCLLGEKRKRRGRRRDTLVSGDI